MVTGPFGSFIVPLTNQGPGDVDADLDRVLWRTRRRTRRRPLARHAVSVRAALVFGLVLRVVSTLWLGLAANWLSAVLALAANVFYVVGYRMVLKRRTTQDIVWGGATGCFPTLIGPVAGTAPPYPLGAVALGVPFLVAAVPFLS